MAKDIRINVGFFDHWKTITIKAELGLDAVESLIRLWCFAAQNKPNGVLSGMSLKAIELSAKWNGIPGQLVSKLVELSFLDFDGKTYALHDWLEHQPNAEKNALRTEDPLPYNWNQRRYSVFIRDDFTCQYCGVRIERPHL